MAFYNLQHLNVLIIDDNKHMRVLIKQVLHAIGVKLIREADDGADAFKEMESFDADVVLCDWAMSPVDGLDFVRLIRTGRDSPNPYVPIIMLTGHTEASRVREARDAGVTEFLAKPISAKSLYSRLISVIERPRPFIKTRTYTGPCRRRTHNQNPQRMKRRKSDAVEEDMDSDANLSQEEVESLLAG